LPGCGGEVLAARRGAVPGAFAAAATRALPRDIAVFTGRQAELAQLMATVDAPAAESGRGAFTRSTGWPGSARRNLEEIQVIVIDP
jgi:hypothetical protein